MVKKITSRERVVMALNHEEPDRVPIDLGSSTFTTMVYCAMEELRKYLNLPGPEYPMENIFGFSYPREDMLNLFDIDTRRFAIGSPDGFKLEMRPDNTFEDEWGVIRKKATGQPYFDNIFHPLGQAESLSDLKKYNWPDPDDPGRYRGLREKAKKMFEETDYAIVTDMACDGLLDTSREVIGLEKIMVDFYINPGFAEAWLDMYTEYCIRVFNNFLNEVGDYVQVVCVTDDLGFQDQTALPPEIYRKFLKPRHKKIYETIKSKTKAKIFQHCCGSVFEILPDIIEEGVDVLHPIQPLAKNMNCDKLSQFKGQIAFWGGIDEQQLLPNGTPEEVDKEVKRVIEILGPGGGFVPLSSHVIQHDTPPRNVKAMFDAIKKYGNYPIVK